LTLHLNLAVSRQLQALAPLALLLLAVLQQEHASHRANGKGCCGSCCQLPPGWCMVELQRWAVWLVYCAAKWLPCIGC
jgi:hypothetical protein